MNIIEGKIRSQQLLQIKRIVEQDNNGDKFIILRRDKNLKFMREYSLKDDDVKNIIKNLAVEDCYAGPEKDYDSNYDGWVFKFNPMFDDIRLYIKIRVENREKSVCISVHEFGKYDEVS